MIEHTLFPVTAVFDGPDLTIEDHQALTGQLLEVFDLMRDGRYRSLRAIGEAVGCGEPSASARLRDLKKIRFGGHTVVKRRPDPKIRYYEYKLILRGEQP